MTTCSAKAIAVLLVLTACATVTAPEEETPSEPAPVAAAPVVAEAKAPVPVAAPPVVAPASPLHVIVRSAVGLHIHRLVDDALVVAAGPLVMRVDAAGEVIYDPSMLRGIVPIRQATTFVDDGNFYGVERWAPVGLGGRSPDALFMSLDFTSGFRGEGGQPITYRHTPEGWRRLDVRGTLHEHHLLELRPWKDGSVLARRGYVMWFPGQEKWDGEDGPTQRQLQTAERAIEKSKKLVVVRGAPKAPELGTTLAAFDSRATGEIFAVTGAPTHDVLRIAADGSRGQVALPGSPEEIEGVVAEDSDRAWVFGSASVGDANKPWLVLVEGGKAEASAVPPCASPSLMSLSVTSDGAQWTTCGGRYDFDDHERSLWTRPADGAWSRVAMPEGVDTALQVVARGSDDVWVVGGTRDGSVLMHTRARGRVLDVPDMERIGRLVHEWNDLLPIGKHCGTGYVPLVVAPDDAASVKAALDEDLAAFSKRATVRLERTVIRGQTVLGLQLGFDAEATAADTAAVRKIAVRRLGAAQVGAPRCWEAEVADDGVLGAWERP